MTNPTGSTMQVDWIVIVNILMVIIGFFAAWTLKSMTENIKKLEKGLDDIWKSIQSDRDKMELRIEALTTKVSELKGAHDNQIKAGGHNSGVSN